MAFKIKNFTLKLSLILLTAVSITFIIYLEHFSKPNINNTNQNKIPDFTYINILNNKNNNIYNLKQNENSKTIIHFWATWCNICKTEFKDIIKYAQNNPNNNILAISIDEHKNDLINFINNLEQYNIKNLPNLILAWDHDKSIAFKLFGTTMVPENYIINNKFEVIDKIVGNIDWEII